MIDLAEGVGGAKGKYVYIRYVPRERAEGKRARGEGGKSKVVEGRLRAPWHGVSIVTVGPSWAPPTPSPAEARGAWQ